MILTMKLKQNDLLKIKNNIVNMNLSIY